MELWCLQTIRLVFRFQPRILCCVAGRMGTLQTLLAHAQPCLVFPYCG